MNGRNIDTHCTDTDWDIAPTRLKRSGAVCGLQVTIPILSIDRKYDVLAHQSACSLICTQQPRFAQIGACIFRGALALCCQVVHSNTAAAMWLQEFRLLQSTLLLRFWSCQAMLREIAASLSSQCRSSRCGFYAIAVYSGISS